MFLSNKFFYELEATEPKATVVEEPVKLNDEQKTEISNKLKEQMGLPTETPAVLTPEQEKAKKDAADKLALENANKIKAEADEKEKLRLEALAKEETPVVKITPKTLVTPKVDEKIPAEADKEIDEAVLLKHLSKKAGKEITSLDDFINPKKELTKKEKEDIEQQRENAKLEFGLQSKKISKQEIESFIEDTKNPQAVAFNFYDAQQKEIDPTITDKEIRENFEEEYGINEEEDSRKYKAGQSQINFIANSLISKKHAKYIGLENEYASFESQQAETAAYQKDILTKAPLYKKDVEAVAERLKTVEVAGHKIAVEKENIQPYIDRMLDSKNSETVISKGYSLDSIEAAIRNSLILDNFDGIVEGILEADRLKNQAGLRGAVPEKSGQPKKVYNEIVNKAEEDLKKRLGQTAN